MAELATAVSHRTEQPPAAVRSIVLTAVLAVGAMVPWYTLRELPLLSIGTAKINLLDALVLCAVVGGASSIVRKISAHDGPTLCSIVFLAYALIPLAVGLHSPASRFDAIREARALAFFALVPVFVAGQYRAGDFQRFIGAYVVGTVIAVIAVFAHVRWLTPLPGYTAGTGAGIVDPNGCRVLYLDWTVPMTALVLSGYGALTASRRSAWVAWTMASLVVGWHLLVIASRSTQAVCAAALILLLGLLFAAGSLRRRRLAGVVITGGIACVVMLAAGAVVGPYQACHVPGTGMASGPLEFSLMRWATVGTDDSLAYRVRELAAGLRAVRGRWLFGEGLGGTIPDPGNMRRPVRPHSMPQRGLARRGPRSRTAGPPRLVYGRPVSQLASGYLFLLVKMGIVGLGLFLALAYVLVAMTWGKFRRAWNTPLASWYALGIAGIAALLALNLVDNVVDIPQGILTLGLFAGMAALDSGGARPIIHPRIEAAAGIQRIQ
jgi:hypothetical protein